MQLPDVQCAWLLLAFCAAPRAQHLPRNVPPADILPYARGHDDAVSTVVEGLLGDQGPGEGDDWAAARQVAFFAAEPGRPRSLGSGAGITGSILGWENALPVLRQRYPDAAARLVQELEGEPAAPCLRATAEAARQLAAEGWTSRPEWAFCARGADAPAAEGELGLGIPGWQRHAVLALHTSFRERVLLPALARDECQQFLRTLLRLRVQRAPPPLRAFSAQGWARRLWSVLSVALQRAVASSALGVWTMPPLPGAPDALPLGDVLDLAIASAPSRLPLR